MSARTTIPPESVELVTAENLYLDGAQLNREAWLNVAAFELRSLLAEVGHAAAKELRVTVGWPSSGGLREGKTVLGECWYQEQSSDQTAEIFINPRLDDSLRILSVLLHEMVHSGFPPKTGHRAPFKKVTLALGYTAEGLSTSISDELRDKLNAIIQLIGGIPHAAISPKMKKKQTTRLVKTECLEHGYIARVTRKWIDELGAPICPGCRKPMAIDGAVEGEDDGGGEC